jgi:hypothetical protein
MRRTISAAGRLARLLDGGDLLQEQRAGIVHAGDQVARLAKGERDDRRWGFQAGREDLLAEWAAGVVDRERPVGQLAQACTRSCRRRGGRTGGPCRAVPRGRLPLGDSLRAGLA